MDEVLPVSSAEEPDAAEVQAALEHVLASQPFRTSKQCQSLLRHIVDRSLCKDDGGLRERVLGRDVFGRRADYDTGEDPVVRMRAADVRKRLAQYYQGLDADDHSLHIELKPGSYRATFRYDRARHYAAELTAESTVTEIARGQPELALATAAGVPVSELPPARGPADLHPASERWPGSRGRRLLFATAVLCVLGLAASAVIWRSVAARWSSPQRRFWAPLTAGKQPVLLYLGSNVAYRFTPEFQARYQQEHGLKQNGPEFFIDLPRAGVLQAKDLLPVPGTFVTVGDLAASTQIVSLLNGWGRAFTLRSADDLSIGDLRNTPAVLIGGFNNRWTLELTNDLPFSFRDGTRIQDRDHPGRSWTVPNTLAAVSAKDDYALISRLLVSKTGGPVLTVSGVGSYGTQAAAEFVSSEEFMGTLLRSAPPGWERKNMQAVLRIKVVAYSPISVDVVATTWW